MMVIISIIEVMFRPSLPPLRRIDFLAMMPPAY
jgi:hypothetical protein